jgi:hypothetical protein
MTGDCHVRFCESRGLQRPRPLAYGPVKKANRGGGAQEEISDSDSVYPCVGAGGIE